MNTLNKARYCRAKSLINYDETMQKISCKVTESIFRSKVLIDEEDLKVRNNKLHLRKPFAYTVIDRVIILKRNVLPLICTTSWLF